jgi:hypothetical protein
MAGKAEKPEKKAKEPKEPKEKKEKAPKDKDAPKRPLSAYMFFSKDMRDVIKAENPSITFGETGKALGAKWAEADEPTKKKYTEMADEDKERYAKEMKAYEATKK